MRFLGMAILLVAAASADVEVPPGRARVAIKGCRMLWLDRIPFARGRADLGSATPLLDGLADNLRSPAFRRIDVIGHVRRSEPARLAEARAQAVIDELVARGIDRARLRAVKGPQARQGCVDFGALFDEAAAARPGHHEFVAGQGC